MCSAIKIIKDLAVLVKQFSIHNIKKGMMRNPSYLQIIPLQVY